MKPIYILIFLSLSFNSYSIEKTSHTALDLNKFSSSIPHSRNTETKMQKIISLDINHIVKSENLDEFKRHIFKRTKNLQ